MRIKKLILFTIFFLFSGSKMLSAQIVALDSSFGVNGIVITPTGISSEINAIALQQDGKIVAAVENDQLGIWHFQLARYQVNGNLDSSFGSNGIINTSIGNLDLPNTVAIQSDGKIIAAGTVWPFSGNRHSVIVRYNTDGSLDTSFGSGGIVITTIDPLHNEEIASIKIQTDGKIVAGGVTGHQSLVIRYNNDGTLDTSFGTAGASIIVVDSISNIYSVALQPDGKIIGVGNAFANNLVDMRFALSRFNSNGTLDSTFGTAGNVMTAFSNSTIAGATSIVIQSDEKIVVAGTSGSGIALARYNPDGTLDSVFGAGGKFANTSFPQANGLEIQSDGKFVVNGSVHIPGPIYNSAYTASRFNPDGSPDTIFGVASTIVIDVRTGSDYSKCMILQPDNKIILAGSSRDSTSTPSDFTIVRFSTDVITNIVIPKLNAINFSIYPNPFNEYVQLEIEKEIIVKSIKLFNSVGSLVNIYLPSERVLDLSQIHQGMYMLSVTTNKETYSKTIIKR